MTSLLILLLILQDGIFLMFCAGVAFWIIYGVLNGDWPVIIANVVTLTLASIILGFKFRYPT